MKPSTTYGLFEASSLENRRLLRQEELILEVTEVLVEALEREGVKRTELASRLKKTRGFVSQLLAGGRNLTLRTLSDVAGALGYQVKLRLCKQSHTYGKTLSVLWPRDRKSTQWIQDPVESAPLSGANVPGVAA